MPLLYKTKRSASDSHQLDALEGGQVLLIEAGKDDLKFYVDGKCVNRHIANVVIEIAPYQYRNCTCVWDNKKGDQ